MRVDKMGGGRDARDARDAKRCTFEDAPQSRPVRKEQLI